MPDVKAGTRPEGGGRHAATDRRHRDRASHRLRDLRDPV